MAGSTTRRRLLAGIAAAAGAPGVVLAACVPGGPAGSIDLQAAIDAGDSRIARRDTPYILDRPLRVPAGRLVEIEPGTQFVYRGPRGVPDRSAGVFEVLGDGVRLIVLGGGEAVIRSEQAAPHLYCVSAGSVAGLEVRGIVGVDCQHVLVVGGGGSYAKTELAGARANVARGIVVIGGGASFARPQTDNKAACFIGYAVDWRVERCRYRNIGHGVCWWGGDANPAVDGRPGAVRKLARFSVSDTVVEDVHGGGIWGSMGLQGVVANCRVERSADVGFDAEGCHDVVFRDCRAVDGQRGALATFYLCRDVRFERCSASSTDRAYPLFRSYNATLDPSDGGLVEIVGGRFDCSDGSGPGSIDTHGGPPRLLVIRDCDLRNVRIDTAFHNMHRTRIAGNRLDFPTGDEAFTAIRAGSSKRLAGPPPQEGRVEIIGNRVTGRAATLARATAIGIMEDDYNAAATVDIRDNHLADGFAVTLEAVNESRNRGIRPRVTIAGNVLGAASDGGPPRLARRRGSHGGEISVEWLGNRDRAGRPRSAR